MRRSSSRAARYEQRARVELLPLLDAIFLVLAVFLLSVVRMVQSYAVPVELPAMASGVEQAAPSVLLVGVDADGHWFLAGERLGLAAIGDAVAERAATDPELRVLLQADRDARHGEVSALLDTVREAGARRVLLVARRPRAPGPREEAER